MTVWSKEMFLETVGWIIDAVNNISRCEIAKRNYCCQVHNMTYLYRAPLSYASLQDVARE